MSIYEPPKPKKMLKLTPEMTGLAFDIYLGSLEGEPVVIVENPPEQH